MSDIGEDCKQRRGPDVLVSPPVLVLGILVVGLALDWFTGATFGGLLLNIFWIPALIFLVLGLGLIVISAVQFRAAGTNIQPTRPAHVLVTTGVYAWSRNPIYLGFLAILTGLAFMQDAPFLLALVPVAFLALRWAVIAREEDYLTDGFGEEYKAYQARVGRWLGRRGATSS